MNELIWTAAVLVIVVVLWLWIGLRSPRDTQREYDNVERSNMPVEIATARLVYSERLFRIEHPQPLVAKVDQVFLTTDGRLVLLETKTRHRHAVFDYDTIELSAQAVLLERGRHEYSHHPVAPYGYIRVVAPGRRPVYMKAPLLDELTVLRLADRRRRLVAGQESPRPPVSQRICRRCPSAPRCPERTAGG